MLNKLLMGIVVNVLKFRCLVFKFTNEEKELEEKVPEKKIRRR